LNYEGLKMNDVGGDPKNERERERERGGGKRYIDGAIRSRGHRKRPSS